MGELEIERLHGAAIERELPALAALRIAVFREYPYLYHGSLDYEQHYLRGFAASARSTLVVARAGEDVVGAATALPLLEHGQELAPPLRAAGVAAEHIYYFGESVLLARYRGHGVGRAFFEQREAAARAHGFTLTAFCAVERPEHHPLRPAEYVPHDAFWTRRGYVRRSDIVANFSWRDLGKEHETPKPMVFWIKELGP